MTISDEAIADEVILRTPVSLAGMTVPSWLNSVPRGDWTSDPNVIEVYIEPNVNRWNEYRRVVKLGDSLQIQFYTDQPVKGIKAQMANGVG